MVRKIILALISIIIPIAGFIIGALYFFRKKEKVWGLIFVLLALVMPIALAASNSSDSSDPSQSTARATATATPTPVSVSLKDILNLRDANEVAADAKYIGMYVSMEGEISEIQEKDITIIPLYSDLFQMSGAKCKFDEDQSEELLALRKGQPITIEGIIKDIDDFMYNMLEIKPCVFKNTP